MLNTSPHKTSWVNKLASFSVIFIPLNLRKVNNISAFFLQDNLHQPQYVEKLEKVIRFLIKEKVLCMEDLDDIWAAQIGQHEAIVKNVHDLLAKLAWDFTPPQMDHLFERFHSSWSTGIVYRVSRFLLVFFQLGLKVLFDDFRC